MGSNVQRQTGSNFERFGTDSGRELIGIPLVPTNGYLKNFAGGVNMFMDKLQYTVADYRKKRVIIDL